MGYFSDHHSIGPVASFEETTAFCYIRSHSHFYHFFAAGLSKCFYITEVAKPGDVERYLIGPAAEGSFQRSVLELLGIDLSKLVPSDELRMPPVRFERLFIGRGASARGREVINEEEIMKRLEPRGFICLDPGAMPFIEQVAAVFDAREVVAPHGAALTHLMWMRPGCKVVELMGEGWSDPGLRIVSGEVGHDYSLLLGPPQL